MNNYLINQLDSTLQDFVHNYEPLKLKTEQELLPLDFSPILTRSKRTPCPTGVGNYGFNSFNFLTFMVLVSNAVANVNNNINNNNNNHNDISLNSVSQDSNSVVSNSDNQNTVMAVILPIPAGRKRRHSQNCLDFITVSKNLLTNWQKSPECSEYFICQAVLQIRDLVLRDVYLVNYSQVKSIEDCKQLYPDCAQTWI